MNRRSFLSVLPAVAVAPVPDCCRVVCHNGRYGEGLHHRYVVGQRREGDHLHKVTSSHDQACIDAGVSCVLYDFRHMFATAKAAEGCPLATLQTILGHAHISTVMKYVHPSQTHVEQAMTGRTVTKTVNPEAQIDAK